jgi:large subunit ribosomal protein L22
MSAADEQDPTETPEADPAGAKAAAKKPAAKAAKTKESGAAKPAAKVKESAEKPAKAAAKKPAAKKPAAKKPAAKAAKASVAAEEKQPATESKSAATGTKTVVRRPTVRAHARYVRTSARKARMVCGHLRGKSVQEARAILAFTPRDVARDWSKLLESAVANAENNHELLEDDLVVREAYADEGPTIKRFRPRAMGRATPIRKRTSHLTITLSPRP